MSAVTVFIDQAVQGAFPPMCAKTGRPTERTCRIEKTIGGVSPVALLLLFLGPIGLVVLVLLAVLVRGERLAVRLPYHGIALAAERRLVWVIRGAGAAGFVTIFAAVFVAGVSTQRNVWLVLAGLCFAVAVAASIAYRLDEIRISLDASRRWVTLDNVHPDFVAVTVAQSGSQRPQPAL